MYVSDSGSDDNDCHSESAPCRNLQTVLDRATNGVDIYITSKTLSLDGYKTGVSGGARSCLVLSTQSYSLTGLKGMVEFTCKGNFSKQNFQSPLVS